MWFVNCDCIMFCFVLFVCRKWRRGRRWWGICGMFIPTAVGSGCRGFGKRLLRLLMKNWPVMSLVLEMMQSLRSLRCLFVPLILTRLLSNPRFGFLLWSMLVLVNVIVFILVWNKEVNNSLKLLIVSSVIIGSIFLIALEIWITILSNMLKQRSCLLWFIRILFNSFVVRLLWYWWNHSQAYLHSSSMIRSSSN